MLTHPIIIILVLLPFSSLLLRPSVASVCGDAVYWGQGGNSEGTLEAACNSKSSRFQNYAHVNVGFLSVFGSGQQPSLNLRKYCPSFPCPELGRNISSCRNLNIKVFLSIGGPTGSYTLSSENDAKSVATYLYRNYLSGDGGQLGDSYYFDGIDFDIQNPGSNKYWDVLAIELSKYSTPSGNVYLSASPRCTLPDPNLDAAIKTKAFNYVWVQFYDDPTCDIRAGTYDLISSFQDWGSYLQLNSPESRLLMGLPASKSATNGGYIDPNDLVAEILPQIKQVNNYGGIMLWNRHYDVMTSYSSTIVPVVCRLGTRGTPELVISQVV